jgi:alpha-beta hydrolase superfamily lysophospholipase
MLKRRLRHGLSGIVAIVMALASLNAAAGNLQVPEIVYRTVSIDGVDVFYREAGPKNAPTVLLLHGFPSSSHMFRNLIPLLADHYHVVAPDFPGYGHSGTPPVDKFAYTYDHLAEITTDLTEKLGLNSYAIYPYDPRIDTGGRLVDLTAERVDVGIRYGAGRWPGLKASRSPASRADPR